MRPGRALVAFSIIAALSVPALAAAGAKTSRSRSSSRTLSKHTSKARKTKFEPHQRAIDDGRATQIQTALIRAGYLSGSPSGHWDAASIAAMTKVQSDNGWQTKLVPDSRALIKLGLGPGSAAPADSAASETASFAEPR